MQNSDPYSIDYAVPPPPGGQPGFSDASDVRKPFQSRGKAPVTHKFDAELDVSEVDDRLRPGSVWTVRGREIGRSRLVFMSRRMCYPSRLLIAAVHLIDDQPVALFGKTVACDYDSDGLYRVEIELIPMPASDQITSWIAARGR